jgi:hypothetical protein
MIRVIGFACLTALCAVPSACDRETDASSVTLQAELELEQGKVDLRFDLDLVVDGKSLSKHLHHGAIFVEGQAGQEYQVRVRVSENTRFEAVVMVDGIDTVRGGFKEGRGLVSYGEHIARGFRLNRNELAAFEFTAPERSMAAILGDTSQLGEIRAVIYLEAPRPKNPVVVYGHRTMKNIEKPVGIGKLGTGAGRRIPSRLGFGGSPFKRRMGPAAARLVLHYDNRQGLCDRGIVQMCKRVQD